MARVECIRLVCDRVARTALVALAQAVAYCGEASVGETVRAVREETCRCGVLDCLHAAMRAQRGHCWRLEWFSKLAVISLLLGDLGITKMIR